MFIAGAKSVDWVDAAHSRLPRSQRSDLRSQLIRAPSPRSAQLVCKRTSVNKMSRTDGDTTSIMASWSIAIFSLASADAVIAFLEVYRPLTDNNILGVPGAWDDSYQYPDMMYFTHFVISNIVIIGQNLLLACIPNKALPHVLTVLCRYGGYTLCGEMTGKSLLFRCVFTNYGCGHRS